MLTRNRVKTNHQKIDTESNIYWQQLNFTGTSAHTTRLQFLCHPVTFFEQGHLGTWVLSVVIICEISWSIGVMKHLSQSKHCSIHTLSKGINAFIYFLCTYIHYHFFLETSALFVWFLCWLVCFIDLVVCDCPEFNWCCCIGGTAVTLWCWAEG